MPATATTAARRCYHWTVALALLALGKRRCTGRCLQVGAVPGPKSAGASSCPQSLAVQGGTGSRFTVRKFRNSIQELPSRAPEFPDRAPELPDEALGISELPVIGYPRRPGAPRFPGPRPRAPGPGPGTPEPVPGVLGGGLPPGRACSNIQNTKPRSPCNHHAIFNLSPLPGPPDRVSRPRCRSEDTAHSLYRVRVTAHMCGVPIGTPHIVFTGSGVWDQRSGTRSQVRGQGSGLWRGVGVNPPTVPSEAILDSRGMRSALLWARVVISAIHGFRGL